MNFFTKFTSGLLISSLLISTCTVFSGCNKKSETTYISADDPWYTTKTLDLDPGYDKDDYVYISAECEPVFMNDRFYIVYRVENRDYIDTEEIMCFDLDGNLINRISISDALDIDPLFIGNAYLVGCEDGISIYSFIAGLDNAYDDGYCYAKLDPDTLKKTGKLKDLNSNFNDSYVVSVKNIDGYDYISTQTFGGGSISSKIFVYKDGEEISTINLAKSLGVGTMSQINDIYSIDGKAIVEGYGPSGVSYVRASLDPEKGTADLIDEPIDLNYEYSSVNDKLYGADSSGIYTIEDGEAKSYIDFNDCEDFDRGDISLEKVLYSSPEKTVISYLNYSPINDGLGLDYSFCIFEKADSNPHAGKKVIDIAMVDSFLDPGICDAVEEFNKDSKKYYAKLLIYNTYSDPLENSDIELTNDASAYASSISYCQTIEDISNLVKKNEGPDMLICSSFGETEKMNGYMEDLTKYTDSDRFDKSKYYWDIIGSCEVDGKLKGFPLNFSLNGLYLDGNGYEDKVGFTFDEYSAFLDENSVGFEFTLNSTTREAMFIQCFSVEYDLFVDDGKVKFDSDEFRAMCDFFKNDVDAGSESFGSVIYLDDIKAEDAYWTSLGGLSDFACVNYYGDSGKLMGLPSGDARGVRAEIDDYLSIFSNSEVKDGCYELLDYFLSDESQAKSGLSNPINRNAAKALVEMTDEAMYRQLEYYDYDDYYTEDMYPFLGLYVPESGLGDKYLELLDSIDTSSDVNISVEVIVMEELRPYFRDETDLDSAIKAMTKRAKSIVK